MRNRVKKSEKNSEKKKQKIENSEIKIERNKNREK